jgi:hypothetical protein
MLSDFIRSRFFERLIFLRITDIVELRPGYEVVSFIFLLECISLYLSFVLRMRSVVVMTVFARSGYFADVFA